MSDGSLAATMRVAMERLQWGLRDLFVTALHYGDVGTEADVRRHLATGDHLSGSQATVLAAALNDGLMAIGDPYRVDGDPQR